MANFAGLLKKTIDAQENPTPQLRARVYARARETVERKLAETNVPQNVAEAQMKALDDAIKSVEADYVAVEQELLSTIMVRKPDEHSPAPDTDFAKPAINNPEIEKNITSAHPFPFSHENAGNDVHGQVPERLEREEQSAASLTNHEREIPVGGADNRFYASRGEAHHESRNENKEHVSHRETPVASGEAVSRNSEIPSSGSGKQEEAYSRSEDASTVAAQQPDNYRAYKTVPDAEPVNMEAIIAAEKEALEEQAEKEQQSAKALGNNQQNGDYDIVSDIFVQAARRTERRAARKRAIVIGLSSAAVIIVVAGVLLTAWSFLSGKDKSHEAEKHVAGNSVSEQPKEKFTQRLLEDGSEVDEGPAKAAAKPGEGTSTSAGTTGTANQQEQAGEATFYQARTYQKDEKVETGTVQWSLVKDKANAQNPEELAVRGNVTIPDEKLSLRLTIRRNTDPSLPAAYLIEAIFIVPDDFEGKAIDNVHELTFKDSEQAPGQQLTGTVEAKIDDDFFLFALSGANPFRDRNLQLMKQLGWIRLVITDKNSRISELTFSKGPNGETIFNQVIDSWLNQNNKPTLYDQKQNSTTKNTDNQGGEEGGNGGVAPQVNSGENSETGHNGEGNPDSRSQNNQSNLNVEGTNSGKTPDNGEATDGGEEDTE